MSRFFANSYDYESGSSSSEEDLLSTSEEELMSSSSSEEEQANDSFFDESESESDVDSDGSGDRPYGPDWFKKPEFRKGGSTGANKFLKNADYSNSEDSDDEGRKVVKSAKDKLLDEMRGVYDKIEDAEMTQDWITILAELDNMTRLSTRAQQQNYGVPNIFVKVLAQVEDAVAATSLQDINNKAVARAYNTTKQRVRKVARDYEQALSSFRENPEAHADDEAVQDNNSVSTFALAGKKTADLSSMATASSESDFFTALRIVIDSRGKKGTDFQAQIKTLEELLDIAKSPYETILAYLNLIPIRFDSSATLSYQPIDQWKASQQDIAKLFDTLEDSIDAYHVSELAPHNDFIEEEPQPNEQGIKQVLGSVYSFVERLDEEFNKSLLNTDPHSSDFLDRLKDEQGVYNLILRSQLYLEATSSDSELERRLARVLTRRFDHIYFKSVKLVEVSESKAWKSLREGAKSKVTPLDGEVDESYTFGLIDTLHKMLSTQKDGAQRRRAGLYQIYFYALNNQFEKAKHMLLSSHIQSSINNADAPLQILFNRTVVQLGLAAFKLCLIDDCHQILNEVSTSTHLRDILGQQSLQRVAANNATNPGGASNEQLCLPFHQHINLDLIDVVFMTCSLLIEVPHMAAFFSGIKVKRIPYSQKSIRRALEHYDKSSFQGPPETLRDHVLYAAKSMQRGDWDKSVEYLKKVPTWSLLPNTAEVLTNLAHRVQVEALRTYIFTYKRFYSKLSLLKLSQLFGLSQETVVEVVSAIISQYDIKGRLDEESKFLVFEKGYEITKLEEVAVKLAKETKYVSERLNEKKYVGSSRKQE
ncbi:translation initiation factor eIF3 core subunit c [Lachancea thermotolerans CBS 6340]|uniref:Eukaryotic translation initiation factor 3 subunit C n=1 Tax=Lachancea thermotolerans (strain ATCC 56472 / CBS 6340 / NRRL Y-8284) TaxID=559295 RepID=C5DDA9_LACTC|nr:KLTH0B09680p [Lachancea thermotolerans CBS 6340]CAR21770.1 KLTH0B09680p [Lachancea thermotolerans CBS 6340]